MSDERFENGYGEDNSGMQETKETAGEGLFREAGSINSAEAPGAGNTEDLAKGPAAGPESSTGPAYGTGAASSYRSESGRHSGTGMDGGRPYYSYAGRDNAGRPAAQTARRGKDREKAGRRIALILAVILVFVLGAGAGAFMSGRTAASAVSGSAPSTKSSAEADAKAAETGSGDSRDQDPASGSGKAGTGASTSQGGKITRVEDTRRENDLSDTTVADIAERVMPAIVSVYNKYTEESQFFGRTYTQEGESAGSGIIIEETDGELLIVTNNHVVEGADSLSVQFINEENCEASLKGTDVSSDLAVISVSVSDLTAETQNSIAIADLGDSDALRIGEHAIAIGNALGYGQSLTVGYISALNREMTSENGITGTFIQTDAAINPGNSGGALLNSDGQVIGINSNKIGGSAIEGMGFAIPISKAIPIIDNLKTQESKTRVAEEEQGVLGIYGLSVTSDVASAYGLPIGAYVEEIIEGSGAAESDLKQGDIITAIDGQTITGMEDLQKQLVYYTAGTEVTLTVRHPMEGGEYEEREIKVTLSRRDSLKSSESSDGSRGSSRQEQQTWPSEEGDDFNIFGFPFGF